MKYKKIQVVGGFKVAKQKEGEKRGEVLTDENGKTKVFATGADADKAIAAENPKKKEKETTKSGK